MWVSHYVKGNRFRTKTCADCDHNTPALCLAPDASRKTIRNKAKLLPRKKIASVIGDRDRCQIRASSPVSPVRLVFRLLVGQSEPDSPSWTGSLACQFIYRSNVVAGLPSQQRLTTPIHIHSGPPVNKAKWSVVGFYFQIRPFNHCGIFVQCLSTTTQ